MIRLLKEMILDFQESEFVTGVPRRLGVTTIKGKATVFVGVRRCGKSTYMFQLMKRLLEEGVPRQNILYLNFFDDRLHDLRQGNLDIILEAYFSLYPDKKNAQKVHFFFDEIQALNDWEPFVDRLMRTEKCEVYITGSSSRMLAREIATQMRGRAISWEMFPFSFREFLDFKGIAGDGDLSTKKRLIVQKAFEEYWLSGGFPEVAGLEKQLRVKVLQEYWGAMLFRDLVERHDISHPRALTDLAHRLAENIGSMYSINKLTGYLKSLGHSAPKQAVSDYLSWFEDAFVLFSVRLFDASLSRANANPKKIYCVDHAMVTAVVSGVMVNSGHLLENLVFAAIRRVTSTLCYYKTGSGREVDFIFRMPDRGYMLVQVCESMVDPRTRKREIQSLSEAMSEMKLKNGIVVTRGEDELIRVDSGEIEVMPAWRFLLSLPDR